MPKKLVLLVDDEESIRESLTELFEHDGVDILTASTLGEARVHLQDREIDFLITDLRLGATRLAGLHIMAAAGLLAADAGVIVLTAYPNEMNRLAAERLGASHFLQKPVDIAVIARIAEAHGIPTAFSAPRRQVSA